MQITQFEQAFRNLLTGSSGDLSLLLTQGAEAGQFNGEFARAAQTFAQRDSGQRSATQAIRSAMERWA
jgi:hypothetical protein